MAILHVGCKPLSVLGKSTYARTLLPKSRTEHMYEDFLSIRTLGDQQNVQACAECFRLAGKLLLFMATYGKDWSAQVSRTSTV